MCLGTPWEVPWTKQLLNTARGSSYTNFVQSIYHLVVNGGSGSELGGINISQQEMVSSSELRIEFSNHMILKVQVVHMLSN